ncbi:MAG: hypothetical protein B7Y73_09550 [Acidocella sp. 35-58-6]|nr:MAG: hypothetical protein B7Y73_09550 [Acidocella sp. 35-58-6]
MTKETIIENLSHVPVFLFLCWAVYRKFFSPKPLPTVIAVPIRVVRIILVVVTFGLLAGCSNPDPLAVANGPVFALNTSAWQPAPQQLAAPPVVTNK